MLNIIKALAFFTFFPGLIYGIITFLDAKPTKETFKKELMFSALICLLTGLIYTVYTFS